MVWKIFIFFGSYAIAEHINGENIYFNEAQYAILCAKREVDSVIDIAYRILPDFDKLNSTQKDVIINNISSFLEICKKNEYSLDKELCKSGVKNLFYPKHINLELTNRCNFFCTHCYKSANDVKPVDMDLNIIKFLVENFASKIPLIHFTGGKPLIHPQILHRKEICNHWGIRFRKINTCEIIIRYVKAKKWWNFLRWKKY